MGIQTLLTDSRFFLYSCVCHCSSSAHKQCPCSYALTHKLPSSFSQLCYSCWSCSSTTHHPSTHIRCYYPISATNFHNPFLASSSSSSSSPLSPPHTTKNRTPREKKNSTILSVQFQKHTKPKPPAPSKKNLEIHENIPPNCNLQLLLSKNLELLLVLVPDRSVVSCRRGIEGDSKDRLGAYKEAENKGACCC